MVVYSDPMASSTLSPLEGLNQLRKGVRALDVRSPGEFSQGHIPGFRNIAILNDEHRHQVGWTYKNSGHESAVELGHQLVDPIRGELVSSWRAVLGDEGLVICWRGGLRSEIAADWMREAGLKPHRVAGGYKALRGLLLQETERAREWVVLGGLTGSGKTELLRALPAAHTLDLEAAAKHRGSAFGGFVREPQPAQQTFENVVGMELLGRAGVTIVENESSLIGRCAVPAAVRAGIEHSVLVRLVCSFEERVRRVHEEYVEEPLRRHPPEEVQTVLLNALARIAKSLGGVRMAAAATQISGAFLREDHSLPSHQPWIESLLKEYYDPMYEYGIKRDQRKLLFEGEFHATRDFLSDLINRRRA